MTQNGVVTKILSGGRAEVVVTRGTACGGHCDGCEACVFDSRITVQADNKIWAGQGDHVIIEAQDKRIMGAAALVYLLPLVTFFGGYAVGAAAMGLGQGGCAAASLIGAAVGAGITVIIGRSRKKIRFAITGYQH